MVNSAISVQLEPDLPSFYPSSVILPLILHLEHLGLLVNTDGSITITRPMTSSSTPPVTSHPLNGGYALPKMENHPKPPPRPSISSKTSINKLVFDEGRKHQIYFRTLGNIIMLVPPLAISQKDLNFLIDFQ